MAGQGVAGPAPSWWEGQEVTLRRWKESQQDRGRNLKSDKASLSPPGLSGDPLEQLVRHFLIETGPKGVKIKGCPSEPYFGEKLGPGRPRWVGLGRPRDFRRVGGRSGLPAGTPGLLSPLCRQPLRPGLPALHLPPVPALLSAHSQQRWVLSVLPAHRSLPSLGVAEGVLQTSPMPLPADLPAGASL